jgi:flagellar biosynthesis/type III secretory pathway M-ring protein FliF/YscJ
MSQDALLLLLRWLFALVAIAVIVAVVLRPLVRVLRHRPEGGFDVPDYTRLVDEEELEIPSEDERGFDRNAAITQARADPRATATLLQKWLKERR